MKKVLILTILLGCINVAHADQYVRGHYRSNGTYIAPYYRTNANSTRYDNYSTKGNYNPYTGQRGYKNPEYNNSFNYNRSNNYRYGY